MVPVKDSKRNTHGTSRPNSVKWQFEHNELPPFIGWDSEGYNGGWTVDSDGICTYSHLTMLFGCSADAANPLVGRKLTTLDMLHYMMMINIRHPRAVHIIFSGEYDLNQILQDLSPRAFRWLKRTGKCSYKGFIIEHTPKKMWKILPPWNMRSQGYKSIIIYDVWSFFNCSYVQAITKFGIGNDAEREKIRAGKATRGIFTYEDIAYVLSYWQSEIGLLPRLGDSIRTTCYRSGFYLTSWYGPGAIAKYMLKTNRSQQLMERKNPIKFPAGVKEARQYAYAGGRFQLFRCGVFYGPVYSADINSAYVAAMRYVPRLDRGKWSHVETEYARRHIRDFGLYRIDFDAGETADTGTPYPLFRRHKCGVDWPTRVTGWYWGPEARLCADDPHARFLDAWEFSEEELAFPWMEEYFNERLRLQELGDPAEKTYKWGLASIYGTCAQQVGWDRKTRTEPSFHQIEWAGFTTSWCRAQMYTVAAKTSGLISIDTDGITSLTPFVTLKQGVALGQWKLTEYHGIIQWQNGVYWLLNDAGEWESKSRGLSRGTIDPGAAIRAVDAMEAKPSVRDRELWSKRGDFNRDKTWRCEITTPRRTYVGYRACEHSREWWRWRHFEDESRTLVMGSHEHNYITCGKCHGDDQPLHDCLSVSLDTAVESELYRIEWLLPEKEYYDPEGVQMLDDDGEYDGIYPDED